MAWPPVRILRGTQGPALSSGTPRRKGESSNQDRLKRSSKCLLSPRISKQLSLHTQWSLSCLPDQNRKGSRECHRNLVYATESRPRDRLSNLFAAELGSLCPGPHSTLMAHTPLLPENLYLPLEPSSKQNVASPVRATSIRTPPARTVVSPRQRESPWSPHCRRLQLRHAGFRAAFLTPQRVSTPLQSSSPRSGSPSAPLSPGYAETQPGSILQEIHNSTRRRRLTPRSPITNIFSDATARPDSPSLLAVATLCNNTSPTTPTPAAADSTIQMSALREISGNGINPCSLGSPVVCTERTSRKKQGRTHTHPQSQHQLRQSQKRSVSSAEAARYIDYLESELATTKAQVDVLTSPATLKSQAACIRSLQHQVTSLHADVAEWTRSKRGRWG